MIYPKRLIEVDLPIKRISAHARREKSIRHGHISTLHIWWARRPLAACRAVLCASLWPDPADPICPQAFRDRAAKLIASFAKEAVQNGEISSHASEEAFGKWVELSKEKNRLDPKNKDHWHMLRFLLLDFIADFANWDNSTQKHYLETSRALTQAAHEALGGEIGTKPLVVDPFAGGGAIPLEALRIGADAFASDLNPVAVLLNKVVLEYIPKYGQRLANEVRKWGDWIKEQAEKGLAVFYPNGPDGSTPIAYLWARTITCEGPGCGAEIPLLRSLWLAKKGNRSIALQMIPKPKLLQIDFEIIEKQNGKWLLQSEEKAKTVINSPSFEGTIKRGSATCPICGYTTPVARIRSQLKKRQGGAKDAKLFCVVSARSIQQGRFYRIPRNTDFKAIEYAKVELNKSSRSHKGALSFLPNEQAPPAGALSCRNAIYGMNRWSDFFTSRQLLSLTTLVRLVNEVGEQIRKKHEKEFAAAVQACLALAVDRQADATSSLCRWHLTGEKHTATFGRQALPMVWDFSEVAVLSKSTGGFHGAIEWVIKVLEANTFLDHSGNIEIASATSSLLPDDVAQIFFTDPPYYDSINYANISDFFYVWLKRTLESSHSNLFSAELTDKENECVVNPIRDKGVSRYEGMMKAAMSEGRRVLCPSGIGVVVFAHKSTKGWEAQLQAMVDAGWIVTASWPIDTEMGTRMNAMGTASLASSIHIVCRPRENLDGTLRNDEIGDWRDVLAELPKRIHEWMPRLSHEGVVGADAIFACLGPALEVFSRYSRVEKASGEVVTLKEYLEQVWAAVSKEALSMIFTGADTAGFEEDSRLTAMWLWTLSTGEQPETLNGEDESDSSDDEEDSSGKKASKGGYVLEFDAARKIAQGLGAHLEDLHSVVEVKGETARLLPVTERSHWLFGKGGDQVTGRGKKKRKPNQLSLFEGLEEFDEEESFPEELALSGKVATVLDRLHQAMILFAAGRGEALKRFLVEEGYGKDQRFWRLAQAFSALYPSSSSEKRWVDGVLARKKGLGF